MPAGIWFINGRQGIKIGWSLALEWILGLNPPFLLGCVLPVKGLTIDSPKDGR